MTVKQKKWTRRSVIVSLLLMGFLWWQHTPGMSELKRLCKKDGGDKIYKVVHTDGYYDVNGECGWSCLNSLIKSGYQYIEFHQEKVTFNSSIKNTGYWRIYKSNKQDPLCNLGLEKRFSKSRDRKILGFFSSGCLAARKLGNPESKYWYRASSSSKYLDKAEEVKLRTLQESVENIVSHQIIAESKYYSLIPYRKSALDYALTFSCKDAGVELQWADFPRNILLPLKTKENEK